MAHETASPAAIEGRRWRPRHAAASLAGAGALFVGRRLLIIGILGFALALTPVWAGAGASVAADSTAASMSPAMVQSFGSAATAPTSQLSVAPPAATVVGDLLVIVMEVRRAAPIATVTSVSDTATNSWTRAGVVQKGTTDEEMWYAVNADPIVTSGSVKVTTTAVASIAMTVMELSGVTTSGPLDVIASRSGGGTRTPSVGPTAVTHQPIEIAVAAIGWATPVTPTLQTAGYNVLAAAQSRVSGEAVGEQAAFRALTTSGSQQYGATLPSPLPWTGIIATFDVPSAPPTPTPTPTATPSPPPGSPIKHIVVIYQENHSFDNVLGPWCDQTGKCNGIPATVTLKGGVVVTPSDAADSIPTMEHSVAGNAAAVDGGKMDGWASLKGCAAPQYACVSAFQPSQIPNLIALARTFAISDATFSMSDSASWGGHLYAVAATTDGFTGDIPSPKNGVTPGQGWGCRLGSDREVAGNPWRCVLNAAELYSRLQLEQHAISKWGCLRTDIGGTCAHDHGRASTRRDSPGSSRGTSNATTGRPARASPDASIPHSGAEHGSHNERS